MIKILKNKILAIVLIVAIFIPIVTYAVNSQNESKSQNNFFYADKYEAVAGETLTMTINLENINYEDFEFTLTSSNKISNITSNEDVKTNIEDNQFKIISNKSEISMNKINLYYIVPNDVKKGDTIELTGTIKKYEENTNLVEEVKDNKKDENNIVTDSTDTQQDTMKTVTISIEIIEKQKDEENTLEEDKTSEENKQDNDLEETKDITNQNSKETNNIKQNESQVLQNSTQKSTTTYNTTSAKTSSVIYEGESNNYLDSLEIDKYQINPQFSKEINTYFISVENDVTSINITATAEDDNAKINIYGADNLKEGINKVLISVTAENGDVKTYRIYVEKES